MDIKRAEEFRKHIANLQAELDFANFEKTIRAKILDILQAQPTDDFYELKQQIRDIFGPQYADFVEQSFSKYDDIIELTNELYADIGIDLERDFQRIKTIEEINRTRLGKYGDQEIRKITRTLYDDILEGKEFEEIADDLKRISGRVTNYANTIARTQLKGYGRALKNEKARIGEVFWFEYIGNIHENTRTFCRERLGGLSPRGDNTYHINEIDKLDNGPKQLKPVITYCGGWNCRHDWEPDPFYKG